MRTQQIIAALEQVRLALDKFDAECQKTRDMIVGITARFQASESVNGNNGWRSSLIDPKGTATAEQGMAVTDPEIGL